MVYCREMVTYNYLKTFSDKNIYLVEDLSCFLNINEFSHYSNIHGNGICNAFRYDVESAQKIIPSENFDVSQTWDGDYWHNKSLCDHAVHSMASYLSQFKTINTDRLHTAILSGIIGKQVNLFAGTYHKIKSVYEISIKYRWPNIKFIENLANWHKITYNFTTCRINSDINFAVFSGSSSCGTCLTPSSIFIWFFWKPALIRNSL